MTEAEWLASDDLLRMLNFVQFGYPGLRRESSTPFAADRKLRLFATSCARCSSAVLADAQLIRILEQVEDFADGEASWENYSAVDLGQLRDEVTDLMHSVMTESSPEHAAVGLVYPSTGRSGAATAAEFAARHYCAAIAPGGFHTPHDGRLAALLRDIFGNPFRLVTFALQWRTDTAVSLAAGMYASWDFSTMPTLADALQDAGCDNAEVLEHCRGSGPHVRGCWVVDVVLGKE